MFKYLFLHILINYEHDGFNFKRLKQLVKRKKPAMIYCEKMLISYFHSKISVSFFTAFRVALYYDIDIIILNFSSLRETVYSLIIKNTEFIIVYKFII